MKKWLTLTLAVVACMCMPIAFADLAKIGPYNITYSTSPGIATFIGVPFTIDTYSGEKINTYSMIMVDFPNQKGAHISILPDGVPRPINEAINGHFSDLTINRSLNSQRDIAYACINDSCSYSSQNYTYYDRRIDGSSGIIAVPELSYDPYVAVYFLNNSTPVIIYSYMSWDKTRVLLDNLRIVYEDA